MPIRIHSPEGAVGRPGVPPAPAPAVLAGRRLAVLDNGKPGAELLLERVALRLAQRTGAVFAGVRRKGSAATPCEEDLLRELARDADLVLTGTADWGSCTSWSLHDTARLEAVGRPTVVVTTTEFEPLARSEAAAQGLLQARIAVVPHPIGGVGDEALRARADAALDEIVALFGGSGR